MEMLPELCRWLAAGELVRATWTGRATRVVFATGAILVSMMLPDAIDPVMTTFELAIARRLS